MIATLLTLLLAISPSDVGSLRIVSQPGVSVIWDEVEIGQTDSHGVLLIEQIPLGRFTIKLQKRGYLTVTREVVITPAEKRLAIELSEIPRVRRSAPPPAPATPPPKPSRREPEKVEPEVVEPERDAPEAIEPVKPVAAEPTVPAAAPDSPAKTAPKPEPAPRQSPAPPRAVSPEPPRAAATVLSDQVTVPVLDAAEGGSAASSSADSSSGAVGADSNRGLLLFLLLAIILAAAVLVVQSRRSRGTVEYRVPRRRQSRHSGLPSEREPVEAEGGSDFIDRLKKREKDLERIETEGEVVEVEVTEIRTVEDDS
jgi:hypothetical protein